MNIVPKIIKNLENSTPRKQTTQLKMGKEPEQALLQRGHTDGQQIHEKMLNVTNHQRNANLNHNEISPHTCLNSYQ